jgi:glyoxylase-like metal-dependent hydrolase (beta-lactamase superfamily II)
VSKLDHPYDEMIFPITTLTSGEGKEITSDIFVLPVQIVNVYFIGQPNSEWMLVDAGMPRSAELIISETEQRFGKGTKPKAILLTHGHFDHVGDIVELINHWQVPVYAHELELPYLTGQKDYPPADPTVDGGLVSEISPLFPNEAIDLSNHINTLNADGSIPFFNEWKWIHTPGHTPGHISLFREKDRALIAGDAFVTVRQESLYKVFTQNIEVNGPPKYFTTNWNLAWNAVKTLNNLNPAMAVTGHGQPIQGQFLKDELNRLAHDFDKIAIPDQGRYVKA